MRKDIHGTDDAAKRRELQDLTRHILECRDDFFRFVSTFDGSTNPYDGTPWLEEDERPLIYDSLWSYFEGWLQHFGSMEKENLAVDPRMNSAIWHQFLRLVPTIWVLICETYDRDPSKLDLIQLDAETGDETRIKRRVKSKLPGDKEIEFDHEELLKTRDYSVVEYFLTGAYNCWPIPAYTPGTIYSES